MGNRIVNEFLKETQVRIGLIYEDHKEATKKREKEVHDEILKSECCDHVVIWAFEASPCIIGERGEFLIDEKTFLHKNYMFGDYNEIKGTSYVYKFLKYNLGYVKDLNGNRDMNFVIDIMKSHTWKVQGNFMGEATHLVVDLVPEWHGIAVTAQMRRGLFSNNEHNFDHLQELLVRARERDKKVHLVWCGTSSSKGPEKKKLYEFFFDWFLKLPVSKGINLYYKEYGFFNKSNDIIPYLNGINK